MHADHAQKLHELPDEYPADAMPVLKKITLVVSAIDYNMLQMQVIHAAGCTVADWVQNNGQKVHQACVLLPSFTIAHCVDRRWIMCISM